MRSQAHIKNVHAKYSKRTDAYTERKKNVPKINGISYLCKVRINLFGEKISLLNCFERKKTNGTCLEFTFCFLS